ncbi:hypothetical protein [Spirillospora sp. NPDC029432]|uniref:hypothetical protein n=1 Tax=Spirillospora sp. NPDC029432 TaxID=3154599 RepID=UPI0034531E3D
MRFPAARLVAGAVLAGAACNGCAAAEDGGVRSAVASLYGAVRDGDGRAACERLVPRAARSLESGGSDCAQEILGLGLRGGPVHDVEVWSDRARAGAGSDTVFLTRWGDGWRVSAAGCRAQGDRPYDCEVSA